MESAIRIAPRMRACRFSSVSVRSDRARAPARSSRGRRRSTGADRDLEEPDAEPPGELARVGHASRRRVGPRHRDADDAVRRRAPRRRAPPSRRSRCRPTGRGRRSGSRTFRRSRRAPGRAPGGSAPASGSVGATGAAAAGQVDRPEVLLEGARRAPTTRPRASSAIEPPSKTRLSLPPTRLQRDQRHAGAPRDLPHEPLPQPLLAERVGGGRDVRVEVEPQRPQLRDRDRSGRAGASRRSCRSRCPRRS